MGNTIDIQILPVTEVPIISSNVPISLIDQERKLVIIHYNKCIYVDSIMPFIYFSI